MSSTNKRTILLVVWLALLGGLYAGISYLNDPQRGHQGPEVLPSQFNAAAFEQKWGEIMTHYAAPPLGPPKAPFTLVEFGDFQCPQCARMRPVIETLVQHSSAQANLYFVHRPFPVDQAGQPMHKYAMDAAEASLAAGVQGKFWAMYDVLYRHQDDLEPGYYSDYAKEAGLDVKRFQADMLSHKFAAQVEASRKFTDAMAIQLTPTVLVRDNATGKITPYVGSDSTEPFAPKGFEGLKQLAANPPWQASPKTARK